MQMPSDEARSNRGVAADGLYPNLSMLEVDMAGRPIVEPARRIEQPEKPSSDPAKDRRSRTVRSR